MKYILKDHFKGDAEAYSWDRNPESNPEKFGLTLVARMDYSHESYSFDYRLVWKDSEGRLWTARDAGCSCPTPFDPDTLKELDRLFSTDDLVDEFFNAMRDSRRDGGYKPDGPNWRDWGKFVHDVAVAQGKA